jgi:iron only hydrogenase large subunit-like protein
VKNVHIPRLFKVAPSDIYQVSITNLTADKSDLNRYTKFGFKDTDIALTTRELAELIKLSGISFDSLPDSNFDDLHGFVSGAGVLYGTPGGAAETTLRAAHHILTNQSPPPSISGLRGNKPQKIVDVDLGGRKLKVAAVSGLADGIKFLDKLDKKDKSLAGIEYVEIIATPGGAVNGGGSPSPSGKDLFEKRIAQLVKIDKESKVKDPFDDPFAKVVREAVFGKDGARKEDVLYSRYERRPGF